MKINKRRILLVDDSVAISQILKTGLNMSGYEAQAENNPAHVLQVARAFRPDLIVLDVAMPGMDGGAVAQALGDQRDLAHIPIIFLTALCSKEDAARAKNNDEMILAKPITVAELVKNIEERLRQK
jgi:DNA-binding response OmpR family regulator